ncbi:unnamed protein product [Phytomonas sp. Hart1]|nr:unnamed protein product [Phytomonas sp. Hart1]|eukprot:CCW69445.1 unnamed protein product [Phytomonas sp. isolate Hart1]
MTAAGSTIYVAVDTPILSIREGIFESSYYGYPIELTLPGVCTNVRVVRRYSDFESLRNQLCMAHWYCIVAPIPEKESLQGKITTRDSNYSVMLEYRRIALRRFLLRIAYHTILGKSPLLARFANDEEWRECAKNPIAVPPFLSANIAEDLVKSMHSPTPGKGDGAEYVRLLNMDFDNGGELDGATIDGINSYIAQLEGNLRSLRDRFQALANRRQGAGEALLAFSSSFGALADGEEDPFLRKAIRAVQQHGAQISVVYQDQSDNDMQKVVSTLSYYVGLCAAVRQTLGNIWSAISKMRALCVRVQAAEARLTSVGMENLESARNALAALTAEKMHREREMCGIDKTFKEELCRFHREKQFDLRELLKVYAELEVTFASNIKSKWEGLRPRLEDLAS